MGDITRPQSDLDQLRNQLAAITPELRNALPKHISAEQFVGVTRTVAAMNPELLQADRKSLLVACMKCAADGLGPDGREAALVIFNVNVANKKKGEPDKWVKKVQYMPMFAGLQKRARNSGEIASLEAHVIYEHDEFVWSQGVESTLIHKPKFPGPRGKAIGAYAVAKLHKGAPLFEVMDLEEINRVRAASKAKDGAPWTQWWGEMARKTVFRRLSKWLPTSAAIDPMLSRDDQPEDVGLTLDQEAAVAVASGSARQLEAPASRLDTLEILGQAEAVAIDADAA